MVEPHNAIPPPEPASSLARQVRSLESSEWSTVQSVPCHLHPPSASSTTRLLHFLLQALTTSAPSSAPRPRCLLRAPSESSTPARRSKTMAWTLTGSVASRPASTASSSTASTTLLRTHPSSSHCPRLRLPPGAANVCNVPVESEDHTLARYTLDNSGWNCLTDFPISYSPRQSASEIRAALMRISGYYRDSKVVGQVLYYDKLTAVKELSCFTPFSYTNSFQPRSKAMKEMGGELSPKSRG
jgi:hypothetical protein